MRLVLFCLILISITGFSQENRKDLSSSKLYISGTYENNKNVYTSVAIKEILKDTLINGKYFQKLALHSSQDISQEGELTIQFQSLTEDSYMLLDEQLKVIHFIKLSDKDSPGTLFGKEGTIALEYIDTRDYFPKDSFVAKPSSPRKYYLTNAPDHYIILQPALKIVEVANNGINYTKQLVGDLFTRISNHFNPGEAIDLNPTIKKGDEIQLFYRRKWYNDTSGEAQYKNKQFRNIRYTSDTSFGGVHYMKFKMNGYNYLSGSDEQESPFLVPVTDSGIYVGQQFITFKKYTPEFKIVNDGDQNYVFIQGIDYQMIGNRIFPLVIQFYSNSPYRYFLLPYFPMSFIEFGNVEGSIPYVKVGGEQYGTKREKVLRTDATHIRSIKTLSEKSLSIVLYVKEAADFDIAIEGSQNKKMHLETGDHVVTLPVNIKKGKVYTVQIAYKEGNLSGSMSSAFTAYF